MRTSIIVWENILKFHKITILEMEFFFFRLNSMLACAIVTGYSAKTFLMNIQHLNERIARKKKINIFNDCTCASKFHSGK